MVTVVVSISSAYSASVTLPPFTVTVRKCEPVVKIVQDLDSGDLQNQFLTLGIGMSLNYALKVQ